MWGWNAHARFAGLWSADKGRAVEIDLQRQIAGQPELFRDFQSVRPMLQNEDRPRSRNSRLLSVYSIAFAPVSIRRNYQKSWSRTR